MRSIYVYTDSRDDSMGSLVVILAASSCTVSIFQHVACADLEGGRGGGVPSFNGGMSFVGLTQKHL